MEFNNLQNIHKKHIILIAIFAALLLGDVFFAVKYFLQVRETATLQKEVAAHKTNAKVAGFLNLFVEKVLKSDTEVSFEDRLKLENAVRDIGDPELLAKWEQFTGGTNETQIQQGVKDLLAALVKKISY